MTPDDAASLLMSGVTLSVLELMLHGQKHGPIKAVDDAAFVEFICADGQWHAELLLSGRQADDAYKFMTFRTRWVKENFQIPSVRAIHEWNRDGSLLGRMYVGEEGELVMVLDAMVGNVSFAHILALNAAWDTDVKSALQMLATRESYLPSAEEATEWMAPEILRLTLEAGDRSVSEEKLENGNRRYEIEQENVRKYAAIAESINDDDNKIWRVMFSAWWPAVELGFPTDGEVSRWNCATRAGRFYLDDDGDVRAEMEQCVQYASGANVAAAVWHWEKLLSAVQSQEGIFSRTP